MRFVLDEDVSHWLAQQLRSMGYDAVSAREADRLGLSDPKVLLRAVDADQTLVTHNGAHFRTLHEGWLLSRQRWERELTQRVGCLGGLSGHHGILLLPHGDIGVLAPAIAELLASGPSLADRFLSWSKRNGWEEPEF